MSEELKSNFIAFLDQRERAEKLEQRLLAAQAMIKELQEAIQNPTCDHCKTVHERTNPSCCDNYEQHLEEEYKHRILEASLENKRLREALGHFGNHLTWCNIPPTFEEYQCSKKCNCGLVRILSSPDHSAIADLYLELQSEVREHLNSVYPGMYRVSVMEKLRDILKRIKEVE